MRKWWWGTWVIPRRIFATECPRISCVVRLRQCNVRWAYLGKEYLHNVLSLRREKPTHPFYLKNWVTPAQLSVLGNPVSCRLNIVITPIRFREPRDKYSRRTLGAGNSKCIGKHSSCLKQYIGLHLHVPCLVSCLRISSAPRVTPPGQHIPCWIWPNAAKRHRRWRDVKRSRVAAFGEGSWQ